jgi:hypothetical protein
MLILAPMHPVLLVYELDQTEGAPLPAHLTEFAHFDRVIGTRNACRTSSKMLGVIACASPSKPSDPRRLAAASQVTRVPKCALRSTATG